MQGIATPNAASFAASSVNSSLEASTLGWERFQWRCGAETYSYEIKDQGLIGRISVSDGRTFALPVVAWEAMLDAVGVSRKSKDKGMSRAHLPGRAGAHWTMRESEELAIKFGSGRTIATLAQEHARTVGAIEHELSRQGLWDRIEKRRLIPPSHEDANADGASPSPDFPGVAR